MGKRLTNEERARRDAAYKVWVDKDFSFSATEVVTRVSEKELRRWSRVHGWWERWNKDLATVDSELADIDRVISMLAQSGPSGTKAYIPPDVLNEIAEDVFLKIEGLVRELGGEHARTFLEVNRLRRQALDPESKDKHQA